LVGEGLQAWKGAVEEPLRSPRKALAGAACGTDATRFVGVIVGWWTILDPSPRPGSGGTFRTAGSRRRGSPGLWELLSGGVGLEVLGVSG
jgi:hypothetical protein